jgi:hypothetical protein
LYRHDEPNEPTKAGLLSYILQKSPFASVLTSVSDPHWFQGGSRSNLLPQSESTSGLRFREPNQCGSMRIQIQILVRLCHHQKLYFGMKNILFVIRNTVPHASVPKPFWNGENQVYLLILVNVLASGSGSRSSFSIQIRIWIQDSKINVDPDLDPYQKHRFNNQQGPHLSGLSGVTLATKFTYKTDNGEQWMYNSKF